MQPQAESRKAFSRLVSAEDLAVARFGSAEGLAIVNKTTLELSAHYAKRFDLDLEDPEVMLTATALAFTRHKEFTLLREIEKDLYTRVIASPDGQDYGEVLFNTTRTGAHRDIHREVDRLHGRGSLYLKELRALARDIKEPRV